MKSFDVFIQVRTRILATQSHKGGGVAGGSKKIGRAILYDPAVTTPIKFLKFFLKFFEKRNEAAA